MIKPDLRIIGIEIDRTLQSPLDFLRYLESMAPLHIAFVVNAFEHYAIQSKEQRFYMAYEEFIRMMLSSHVSQEEKNKLTLSLGLFVMHYFKRHTTMMDGIRSSLVQAKIEESFVPEVKPLMSSEASEVKTIAITIHRTLDKPFQLLKYLMCMDPSMQNAVLAFDQYTIPEKENRFWLAFSTVTAIMATRTLSEKEKTDLVMAAGLFIKSYMIYHKAMLETIRSKLRFAGIDGSAIVPANELLHHVSGIEQVN